jgi:hypothetical protein
VPSQRGALLGPTLARAAIAVGDSSLPPAWRERVRRVWLAGEHVGPVDRTALAALEQERSAAQETVSVPLPEPTLWPVEESASRIYTPDAPEKPALASEHPGGVDLPPDPPSRAARPESAGAGRHPALGPRAPQSVGTRRRVGRLLFRLGALGKPTRAV